jgi:hypothetical protein
VSEILYEKVWNRVLTDPAQNEHVSLFFKVKWDVSLEID